MLTESTERETLPSLYDRWVAQLLDGTIPRERRATCHDCAMCSASGAQSGPRNLYYEPHLKCCTFIPVLPNFLVGRILSDDDPATQLGRMTVEKRIAEGIVVTPLGLGDPPAYSVVYDNISPEAFGRSRALRCPHYLEDSGRCGIWQNRNSVCSTWFCKHVRGQVGHAFWRNSLLPLLHFVEQDLAYWCLLQLEFGDDALRHLLTISEHTGGLTAKSIDNQRDTELHKRIWAGWCGREADFFVKCAELVGRLSWDDVLRVSGPKVHTYARLAKQAFSTLTADDIPAALTTGIMQILQIQQETTRVVTYSPLDPVDVPNVIMAVLHYFDGRPTGEVVDIIASKTSIRLEPSLVRKLLDFGLLIPSSSALEIESQSVGDRE